MDSTKTVRIVIIGAGIIGASMAYRLSRRTNVAVTVIERDVPGSGASGHSFAWVNAFGKSPGDYHAFNRRSLDMWYRFAHQLDEDIGVHYGGEMQWENRAESALQLRQHVRQLQNWGYPCRLITPQEMMELEPGISADNVLAASYAEADIHVELDKCIDICLQCARRSGTIVHPHTTVTGFGIHKGRITNVKAADSEFPCDVAVLASGVHTTELAALAKVTVPQQRSPGIVVKTTSCPKLLQNAAVIHAPPVDENRQHLHLRQLTDGTLRIGEGTQEGINRDTSQRHADALLARAKAYLPAIGNARVTPVPLGYRPMPLDGFPILGFTPTVPNLYIALMHSGVTLAPLVSEMAMLEIVDGARVELFAPYRLERFL